MSKLQKVTKEELQDYIWEHRDDKILDVSMFDTSKITDMSDLFLLRDISWEIEDSKDSKYSELILNGSYDVYEPTWKKIKGLENWDTSNVTNMSGMFSFLHYLKTLDITNFDTSNVMDMSYMFWTSSFATLDLSNFDTNKVKNMEYMFGSFYVDNLDISSFDTSNVTDMSCMFETCLVSNIDLSNFDTSNVKNMYAMFRESEVKTLDISNFKISKETNVKDMFEYCYELTNIIAKPDILLAENNKLSADLKNKIILPTQSVNLNSNNKTTIKTSIQPDKSTTKSTPTKDAR